MCILVFCNTKNKHICQCSIENTIILICSRYDLVQKAKNRVYSKNNALQSI